MRVRVVFRVSIGGHGPAQAPRCHGTPERRNEKFVSPSSSLFRPLPVASGSKLRLGRPPLWPHLTLKRLFLLKATHWGIRTPPWWAISSTPFKDPSTLNTHWHTCVCRAALDLPLGGLGGGGRGSSVDLVRTPHSHWALEARNPAPSSNRFGKRGMRDIFFFLPFLIMGLLFFVFCAV